MYVIHEFYVNVTSLSNGTSTVSPESRRHAGLLMFITSFIGIAINFYITSGFVFGLRYRGGFFVFSTSKTFANIIVCTVCIFWLCSAILSKDSLTTETWNIILSQFLMLAIYICIICTQFFLSVNRLYVMSVSSRGKGKGKNSGLAVIGVIVTWSAAIIWSMLGFPDCTCVFSSDKLLFFPLSPCHVPSAKLQLYFTTTLILLAICVNILTFMIVVFAKTKKNAIGGIKDSSRRKKRNVRLFAQSFVQTLVYLTDVVICSYEISWGVSLSLFSISFVPMIDGFVMLVYNRDVKPACVAQKNLMKKTSVISISVAESRV